jgi:hypothetical protein
MVGDALQNLRHPNHAKSRQNASRSGRRSAPLLPQLWSRKARRRHHRRRGQTPSGADGKTLLEDGAISITYRLRRLSDAF